MSTGLSSGWLPWSAKKNAGDVLLSTRSKRSTKRAEFVPSARAGGITLTRTVCFWPGERPRPATSPLSLTDVLDPARYQRYRRVVVVPFQVWLLVLVIPMSTG